MFNTSASPFSNFYADPQMVGDTCFIYERKDIPWWKTEKWWLVTLEQKRFATGAQKGNTLEDRIDLEYGLWQETIKEAASQG